MSDLTSLEQRFRAANPVPDPSNPPMAASSAAAALLEFEARSVEMQTDERTVQLDPKPTRNVNRLIIGAAAAAVTVVLIILFASGMLGGDDEVIERSAESFCAIEKVLELPPPPDTNPETAQQARDVLSDYKAAAPEEIRTDAERTANAWIALYDIWEAGDWDRSAIDTNELSAAQGELFNGIRVAEDRLDAWIDANCP